MRCNLPALTASRGNGGTDVRTGGPRVSRRTMLGAAVGGTASAAVPVALVATATSGQAATAPVLDNRMTTDAQWPDFLRGQDLLGKRLPAVWYDAPFLGDGRLGSMVYREPNTNQIRFTVQHGEVQDHRPQYGSAFGVCRLPVGHLTLEPVGTISSVDWRLDLWNAELVGTVTTSSGTLTMQVFIDNQVLVAAVTPGGGEQVRWTFHPEKAISPAATSKTPPSGYTENPPPTTKSTGDVQQVIQSLLGGGQTATAYRQIAGPTANQKVLYLSVAHSFPSTTAESTSLNRVNTTSAAPLADEVTTHRTWWHGYYRKSFLSIP